MSSSWDPRAGLREKSAARRAEQVAELQGRRSKQLLDRAGISAGKCYTEYIDRGKDVRTMTIWLILFVIISCEILYRMPR
jgi:predicted oxidoreductase